MYQAKSTGRNQVHFYAPVYERQAKEQLELEIALQRALQAKALRVAYQPKVDATGTLRGAEALVRWSDEKLGIVPPDRLIAIAEESGLIAELDAWVHISECLRRRLQASSLPRLYRAHPAGSWSGACQPDPGNDRASHV